jgi:hypothetical protein
MCQVNTDPMRSEKGYLEVVGKKIQIFFSETINYKILLIHKNLWLAIIKKYF